MYCSFTSRRDSDTHLQGCSSTQDVMLDHSHYRFANDPAKNLADSNGPNTRLLVERYQADRCESGKVLPGKIRRAQIGSSCQGWTKANGGRFETSKHSLPTFSVKARWTGRTFRTPANIFNQVSCQTLKHNWVCLYTNLILEQHMHRRGVQLRNFLL